MIKNLKKEFEVIGYPIHNVVGNRDEIILQYIDILQYFLQQYNTIRLKGNINILHIAIYCDILQYIAMFVILML